MSYFGGKLATECNKLPTSCVSYTGPTEGNKFTYFTNTKNKNGKDVLKVNYLTSF